MHKKKKRLIKQKFHELYERLDKKTCSEKDKQVMKDMMDVYKEVVKACENNDEAALERIRQRLKDDNPMDKLVEDDEAEGTEKD
jgi:hypothetical protein